MESLIGKILPDEKDNEYLVISELTYQSMPCVYASKYPEEDGEKKFFQVTTDGKVSLVTIQSEKMIEALSDRLFNKDKNSEPRKIGDNESINDYLAYLDDFYKTKVINIM